MTTFDENFLLGVPVPAPYPVAVPRPVAVPVAHPVPVVAKAVITEHGHGW